MPPYNQKKPSTKGQITYTRVRLASLLRESGIGPVKLLLLSRLSCQKNSKHEINLMVKYKDKQSLANFTPSNSQTHR